LLAGLTSTCFAGVDQISHDEFVGLTAELAHHVNLFRDAWNEDPDAKFYGGTSRDFAYWVKSQFQKADTREKALKVETQLRSRPSIQVREFIVGESDIDIISNKKSTLSASTYGVRKIDTQSTDLLNPKSTLAQDDRKQGFIPAEKIILGSKGLESSGMGDGISEIYRGKLSVHFSDPKSFSETNYAKQKLNHPILLALRYLRLQAVNYFNTYGSGFPDPKLLETGFDHESRAQVQEVIHKALDGKELTPYLAENRFRSWLNGSIQKSFRSYTNPTAALKIMKAFQVDRLPELYPGLVEPINQYVFRKYRDEKLISEHLKKYSVDRNTFYLSPAQEFKNGLVYHGTESPTAFRSILFQGVLPSTREKNNGAGFYIVAEPHLKTALEYSRESKRVVQFDIDPNAKIVDVDSPQYQNAYKAFLKDHPKMGGEDFSDYFGTDIEKFGNQWAYVVKNSSVLLNPKGTYLNLMFFPDLIKNVKVMHDPIAIMQLIKDNGLSPAEANQAWEVSPVTPDELKTAISESRDSDSIVEEVLTLPHWKKHPELLDAVMVSPHNNISVMQNLMTQPEYLKESAKWIPKIMSDYRETNSLIRLVLSKDFWLKSHPEFVQELLNEPSNHKAIAEYILPQPIAETHPEWKQAVYNQKGADRELIQRALCVSNCEHDAAIIQGLIERYKKDPNYHYELLVEHVLPNPTSRPEWILEIAMHNPKLKPEIVKNVLSQEHWANHPLFQEYLEDKSLHSQIAESVLSRPWSVRHSEWVEIILADMIDRKEAISRFQKGLNKDPALAQRLIESLSDTENSLKSIQSFGSGIAMKTMNSLGVSNYSEVYSIIQILSYPHWVNHPKYKIFVDQILNTELFDPELARLLIPATPQGRVRSAWVDTLLQRGSANVQLASVLGESNMRNDPHWTQWVQVLLNKNSQAVDDYLVQKVMPLDQAALHPKWIKILIAREAPGRQGVLEFLIKREPWSSHPEILKWARSGDLSIENLKNGIAHFAVPSECAANYLLQEISKH